MSASDWTRVDGIALAVLAASNGVARLRDFLAAELTPRQVAAIFRRGVIQRPRDGWYVHPDLPWRAKLAIGVGGVLGCISAADSYGIPVPPWMKGVTHVRLAPNTPRVRHSRDKRWYVRPGEDERVERHYVRLIDEVGAWRVTLVDALLQLVACVPADWFVAALDAALHQPRGGGPKLDAEGWSRLVTALPERLRPLLALVDPRSESPLETLLRLALLRRGHVAIMDLQFWPTPFQRVDFLLAGRLIVETDGAAFHDPVEDAIRDAELRARGYRILRFDFDQVVHHMDEVLEAIEAELRSMSVV